MSDLSTARRINLAPMFSAMEMGALFDTYTTALQSGLVTDLIKDAKQKLAGDELKRLNTTVSLLTAAGTHAMLQFAQTDKPQRDFPESLVGENSFVLYLLQLGAVSHKSGDALTKIKENYLKQVTKLAEKVSKEPRELTFSDLSEAILSGDFDPNPVLS